MTPPKRLAVRFGHCAADGSAALGVARDGSAQARAAMNEMASSAAGLALVMTTAQPEE